VVSAVVLASLLLATGSGGFGASDAERSIQAAVVDDDSAYLDVERNHPSQPNGLSRDVRLLTLANAASTTLDSVVVSATETSGGAPTVRRIETPTSLPPGETGTVTADVVCQPDATGTPTLSIEARGDGLAMPLHRTATMSCTGDPNRGSAASERATATPPANA
jgi:hypothetical protein